jgi:hypothetical protein
MVMWINILMIGYFLTKEDVGVFSAAHRTALLTEAVLLAFNSVFAPIIADLYNRKEQEKLESLFKITAKWIFAISLPIIVLVAYFSREVLSFFGQEFVSGASCLLLLAGGYLASALVGSAEYVLMIREFPGQFFNSALLLSDRRRRVINPGTGFSGRPFQPYFLFRLEPGPAGWVHVISGSPYRMNFLKPLLAGGVSFVLLTLVSKFTSGLNKPVAAMAIGSSVFLAGYLLTTYWLGIEEEDKVIVKALKGKVNSLARP